MTKSSITEELSRRFFSQERRSGFSARLSKQFSRNNPGFEKGFSLLQYPGEFSEDTTDTTVAQLLETDIYVTRHPFLDDCLLIKVQGPFDIPVENKRITVDKATAESVLLGANVYAPGVKKCQGVHKSDSVNIVDTHGQIVATGIARLSETEILSQRLGLAVKIKKARKSAKLPRNIPISSGINIPAICSCDSRRTCSRPATARRFLI